MESVGSMALRNELRGGVVPNYSPRNNLQNSNNVRSKIQRRNSKLRGYSGKQERVPTDADLLQYVLSGRLKYLPKLKSNEVRIFLSSTFTDMYVERNVLFKSVYPKLQSYCRKRWNMDFQVVDMRWGIQSSASNDHSAAKLCMAELKNCQDDSLGPNFVLLLGQRYGTRQLPPIIPEKEFEMLLTELKTSDKPQADLDLLQKWYLCDANAQPAERRLQPMDAMGIDQSSFYGTIEPCLLGLLRTAAEACWQKNFISDDTRHRYFWSVTDEEVYNGIVTAIDPNAHCLCFTRHIVNLNLKHSKVGRFIDLDDSGNINVEAQALRDSLHQSVYGILDKRNIAEFYVPWCDDGGINETVHEAYLKEFSDSFFDRVVAMIDKAASKGDSLSTINRSPMLSEVIEHGRQALAKVATFQGRDDVLDKLKEYITGDSKTPLTVHGGSGFGKTSILAIASINVFQWFDNYDGLIVVRRFLGTTPDSTNVESLLRGIVSQVCTSCDMALDPPYVEDPTQLLKKLFDQLPRHVQLVLFLDSLDQLSPAGNAHALNWIPFELPDNVKLIVSTLSQEYGILDVLLMRGYQEDMFAKVELLNVSTSLGLLKRWISSKCRSLTADQEGCLKASFERSGSQNSPLYVKLMFDIFRDTPSYMDPDKFAEKCNILENPRKCILYIFQELRKKHGENLVNTVFAFLHLSYQGLTENELLDILSLDDRVLNDVFQFHVPPLRRMPAVLWTRIRHDVAEYIVERDANGAKVLAWYHRQFIETGSSEFASKLSSEIRRSYTSVMAEYFRGTWANGKLKPFTYTDFMVKKLQLSSNQGEADRFVSDQPNILANGKPNLRKLSQLPRLLTDSGQTADFIIEVAGSIQPLVGMMSSFSFSEVDDLLQNVTSYSLGQSLYRGYRIIKLALLLCSASASVHPSSLGSLLAGRLLPFYGASAVSDHLLDDIYSKGLSYSSLVLRHNQLEGFGSRLIFEIVNEHTGPIYSILEVDYDGTYYIVSVSTKVLVLDIGAVNVVMRYCPKLSDGDHFNIVAAPNGPKPEHYAVSLAKVPRVCVFSVKRQELVGILDCHKAAIFDSFTITDMLAFCVDKVEMVAVWSAAAPGFLIYTLKDLALVYCHHLSRSIFTVVLSNDSMLTTVQPGELSILTVSCKAKEIQVRETGRKKTFLPENAKISAKCINLETNSSAVATADCKIFVWTGPQHQGMRIALDSPAHYLAITETTLIACTKRFVYSIDIGGGLPSVTWRIQRLLDGAKYLNDKRIAGYRLGVYTSFAVDKKEKYTEIFEVSSFTGHTKSITGLINRDLMTLSSSADGTIRVFTPFKLINKHIEQLPKFDRLDVRVDFVRGTEEYAVTVSVEARQAAVWNLQSGKILRRLFHDGAAELREAIVLGQNVVIIDSAGLVFFWNVNDRTSQPFSTVSLPGFYESSITAERDLLVVSPGAIVLLNVSSGSVITKRLLQPERKLIGCSSVRDSTILLVDPDHPTVEMLMEETVVRKQLSSVTCLQKFGTDVTGFFHSSHIFVFVFARNVVFYNNERSDILLDVPLKRATLLTTSGTVIAARSGLNLHFFDVHNGVTKLGSLRLFSINDMATLSPDGLHCLIVAAPRLLQLYRISDLKEIGKYPCYCDVSCAAMTADNRHVLLGMADTRLLAFLVVDSNCEGHMQRVEGILQKPTSAEQIEQRKNMLDAATEELSSSDEEEMDLTSFRNINGISVKQEDNKEQGPKSAAYADFIMKGMWRKNVIKSKVRKPTSARSASVQQSSESHPISTQSDESQPSSAQHSHEALPVSTDRPGEAQVAVTDQSDKAEPIVIHQFDGAQPADTDHLDEALPANTHRPGEAQPSSTHQTGDALQESICQSDDIQPADTDLSDKARPTDAH